MAVGSFVFSSTFFGRAIMVVELRGGGNWERSMVLGMVGRGGCQIDGQSSGEAGFLNVGAPSAWDCSQYEN